jgi:hypothetical protein
VLFEVIFVNLLRALLALLLGFFRTLTQSLLFFLQQLFQRQKAARIAEFYNTACSDLRGSLLPIWGRS